MVQYQQQLAAIVAKDPNVESLFLKRRRRWRRLDRQHRPYLYETQTASERPVVCSTASGLNRAIPQCGQLIRELRPKLARVPGIRVSLQNPPVIRVGGTAEPQSVPIYLAKPRRRGTLS